MERDFEDESNDNGLAARTLLERKDLPLWIPDDDDDEGDASFDRSVSFTDLRTSLISCPQDKLCQSVVVIPRVDSMPPDVSAAILQCLNVQEIATVSQLNKAMYRASRNPDLWKLKFCSRWHFSASDDDFDWYVSYIQAYQNTNDLWVMHWNCVEPSDSLAPGRCCIREQRRSRGKRLSKAVGFQELCPTCRYGDMHTATKLPQTIKTTAQAVGAATALRLQQHSSLLVSRYSSNRARRAFTQSSTLHRTISTQQYSSNSLGFLSDLLFFEVHDGSQELEDLKEAFFSPKEYHHDGSDTCLHSWHVAHFINPDFNRPLKWKISIQRPDCFTVYPSEGYLKPGEAQSVVFGVKPLGSMLAHATHQLNAHREGVDEFWANMYAREAHLPAAPFQIHYQHALAIPCRHVSSIGNHRDSLHFRQVTTGLDRLEENRSRTNSNLKSPWQHGSHVNQPLRTMRLSAHANVNYSFNEFRRSTLVPFDIRSFDGRLLVFCAPQIMLKHPSVWKKLENMDFELEESFCARAYRTEQACRMCGHSWGERLEELGQAYVLAKIECELAKQSRDRMFQRIRLLLVSFCQHTKEDTSLERHLSVCVTLQRTLASYRGAPWLSVRQQQVLLQWEELIDNMCQLRSEEVNATSQSGVLTPWRHAGIYRDPLCTDSVFSSNIMNKSKTDSGHSLKEEPRYLQYFAHLAHNGGRFCLGPQEDPNHLRQQDSSRLRRRQKGLATDMFMDDPISGFQSAFCVLYDPRSLLIHGMFDRVPYPGTVVRRPKLPRLPALGASVCPFESTLESFIESPGKLSYYEFQDSLDLESLFIVDSICGRRVNQKPHLYPKSLQHFLCNIPPPGAGRFPLSSVVVESGDAGDGSTIQEHKFGEELVSDSLPGTTDAGDEGLQTPIVVNQGHVINDGIQRPRLVRILRAMSIYMGLADDDYHGGDSLYADRRILISAQWMSISLMTAPLFCTLIARFASWVPATPVEYKLRGLPYTVESEMRYLTEKECGIVALVVVFLWLSLGRYIERYVSRDFLRAMLEDTGDIEDTNLPSSQRLYKRFLHGCQRAWDAACPLFLQRIVFVPHWNRRSQKDLLRHAAYWRSRRNSIQDRRSTFLAADGGGPTRMERRVLTYGGLRTVRSFLTASLVMGASFCVCSPHFGLNLLTVFLGSISVGCSMSLESMEATRVNWPLVRTAGSSTLPLGVVTLVSYWYLVGQMVGSSGGIWFLVNFVLESIFLFVGGAVSFSPSAAESWVTFCCLLFAAFWGYMLGRVAVLDGMRKKKRVPSSIVLCICIVAAFGLLLLAVFGWEWDFPVSLVILRPTVGKGKQQISGAAAQFSIRQLQ